MYKSLTSEHAHIQCTSTFEILWLFHEAKLDQQINGYFLPNKYDGRLLFSIESILLDVMPISAR